MKRSVKSLLLGIGLLGMVAGLWSCAQLKQLGQTVTNLAAIQFKLDSLRDFQLAGIALSNKTSLSLADAPKAIAAYASGKLPASFTLNVAAVNPNNGHSGTTAAPATLIGFPWTLIVDSTLTVSGNITDALAIPAGGQQTLIPLTINLDLMQFFRDKGYESLVSLALAIGGAHGSTSHIVLRARPEVKTQYGPIRYPREIEIIDKEFRGK